jgi:signal transduction histidine kinase
LAAALAVPLMALLLVTVVEMQAAAREAVEVRTETQLARSATGPGGFISRLQDERTWAALELNGLDATYEAPVAGYPETRSATDEALRAFRSDVGAKGGAVEATYREALASLDDLAAIRRDIDANTAPRTLAQMPEATALYDRYAALVERLLDANSKITLQVRDVQLRQGTELATLASQQIELSANVSRETTVDALLSPNGLDTREEKTTTSMLLATFDRNNHVIETTPGRYGEIVDAEYPAGVAEALHANVTTALEVGTIEDLDAFLAGTQVAPGEGYQGLRDATLEVVADRADTLNAQATARQRLFGILAIGAFVLAVIIMWFVSRSITRPLQSLTRQATDVAGHRLPDAVRGVLETPPGQDVQVPHIEPVAVATRDEVADVTHVINRVQDSVLGLAVEQAVLRRNIADSFVNLGRRNQNLLGRQLAFITELESNEIDPDTLAALFRLDHLATRMRRNAESLLVLAGIEPSRQWRAPVRITDVIRAALGEVEDYDRVRLESVEPETIVGSAAADLAHLLAELLENSLTFSPPDCAVVVRGQWYDREGYRLTIIDQGMGMAGPAIDRANRRLAGTESFTVAPSKYLGHYVAGRLAARHGIGIKLHAVSPLGLASTVDLPLQLCDAPTRSAGRELPPARPAPAALPAPAAQW